MKIHGIPLALIANTYSQTLNTFAKEYANKGYEKRSDSYKKKVAELISKLSKKSQLIKSSS